MTTGDIVESLVVLYTALGVVTTGIVTAVAVTVRNRDGSAADTRSASAVVTPDRGRAVMLVLALALLLLFGALGFAAHVLWWGVILAAVVMIAQVATDRGARS